MIENDNSDDDEDSSSDRNNINKTRELKNTTQRILWKTASQSKKGGAGHFQMKFRDRVNDCVLL